MSDTKQNPRPIALPASLCSGFAEFWERTQRQWMAQPIAQRNHIKRLGLAPDKEVSKMAYIILKSMPATQTEIDFTNSVIRCHSDERINRQNSTDQ